MSDNRTSGRPRLTTAAIRTEILRRMGIDHQVCGGNYRDRLSCLSTIGQREGARNAQARH